MRRHGELGGRLHARGVVARVVVVGREIEVGRRDGRVVAPERVKALQDLQDKYTKAGKLDEAVAIRDYLRAGGPGRSIRLVPGKTGYVIR